MTMLDIIVLCVMGISSLWVFDFIVFTLKSAPKASNFGVGWWVTGGILLALGIGHFTLGGLPL